MTLSSFVLLVALDAAVDVSCVSMRSASMTSGIDELPDSSQDSSTDTKGQDRVLFSLTLEILPVPSHSNSFVGFIILRVFPANEKGKSLLGLPFRFPVSSHISQKSGSDGKNVDYSIEGRYPTSRHGHQEFVEIVSLFVFLEVLGDIGKYRLHQARRFLFCHFLSFP